MPSKIRQIRLAYNDTWDIIFKKHYEFIPSENRWYDYKDMIMYVPKDDSLPKIRVL